MIRLTQLIQFVTLALALIATMISTGLLWLIIADHGVFLWSDSGSYLRTAVNFAQGNGLGQYFYQPASDAIVYHSTTHWPPLTSLSYSLFIFIGFNSSIAPSIVSLLGWIALLLGIGVLTYRLGHSFVTASLAVVVAALHPFFLGTMSAALSEVLFLPLLVWLMVIFVDLPSRAHGRILWLCGASFLLSLLLLARYVGIFVLIAVICWWIWVWWSNQPYQWGLLFRDMFALLSSVLPLGLWIITSSTGDVPASGHFATSTHTFFEGLYAFVYSIIQMSILFIPFNRIQGNLGWYEFLYWIAVLTYLFIFVLFAIVLLKHTSKLIIPHRSPVVAFLLLYSLLYTLAQPMLSFYPMDARDAVHLLTLALPWVFGSLAVIIPKYLSYSLLYTYTALVILLAVGPIVMYGLPAWATLNPPAIQYLNNAELHNPAIKMRDHGILRNFGSVGPVRALDSVVHHQRLTDWLVSLENIPVVITNENIPIIFSPQGFTTVSSPVSSNGIQKWLDEGDCISQYSVILVVFDWRFLPFTLPEHSNEPAQLREAIEQKCPDLIQYTYEYGTTYQLNSLMFSATK